LNLKIQLKLLHWRGSMQEFLYACKIDKKTKKQPFLAAFYLIVKSCRRAVSENAKCHRQQPG